MQDYGEFQYVREREHEDDSEFEEQLMAVQELIDQGMVSVPCPSTLQLLVSTHVMLACVRIRFNAGSKGKCCVEVASSLSCD